MSQSHVTWQRHGRPLVELADAWSLIAAQFEPLPIETVAITSALDRVLARDVKCRSDFPTFDKSVMDGFAVRSADCAAPGASLSLIGVAAAGHADVSHVGPGQAVRINTGAPMPPGADAVIRLEDSERSPDGARIKIARAVAAGVHVQLRGSYQHRGEVAVAAPMRLNPAQVAAIAATGSNEADVYRQIDISIVSTGDELVAPGGSCKPGQIIESNGLLIASLVHRFGARPHPLGIVGDDAIALRESFTTALQSGVVITCGGMSMGTLDLVPQTFEALGVNWLFHGVNVRPAKPVAYGRGPGGQHVFGLPGNPGSAFVAMHLFVRPLVDAMNGLGAGPPRWKSARLTESIKPHKDPRPAVLPAVLGENDRGETTIRPLHWQGSGDAVGLVAATALIHIPHPDEGATNGDIVKYVLVG